MENQPFYRRMFVVASLYDLILGLGFFLFYPAIYAWLSIQAPESPSYLHMAAAFVFVQGVGYAFVWRNLERNVDIIRLGIIYKLAYAGVVFYYRAAGQLPHLVYAGFGLLDLVFVVLFAQSLKAIGTASKPRG